MKHLLLLAGAAVVGVMASTRKKKPVAKSPGASVPATKDERIDFVAEGESHVRLQAGDRVLVKYDPLSPLRYEPVPTTVTAAFETPDGFVGFLVTETMPTGGVDQVYVQARDQDGNLVGEHKITIMGP